MAKGGARPGAGRPKGQTNLITIVSLREAFEEKLGMTFQQALAEVGLKFFKDIRNDHNVDIGSRFLQNMANKMIQPLPQVVEIDDVSMTAIERQNRINNLLTRRELSVPVTTITTVNLEDSKDSE